MGLWIANFLARSGHDIIIADIYEKTLEIAKEHNFIGVILKGDDLTSVPVKGGYFDCDVAVIAVTINVTPDVIRQVGPQLRPGSLLMDITSIKGPAMKAMDEAVGSNVSVLGTHPMFGPDALSFLGQTCVLIPSQSHPSEQWLKWWLDLLEQEHALHIISTAEEHDQMMLAVQVLLHYVLICFGATLPKIGVNLNQVNKFKSPLYEIMVGLISRILSQPPETYYWIQKNPYGEKIRDLFIRCSNEISDTLKGNSFLQYDKLRLGIREDIGETNIAAFSSVAATIMRDRAYQKKTLLETEGKIVCIENVESHKIHYGRIRKITPDIVTIEKLNKKGEIVTVSLKKARLLNPEEINKWKLQNLRMKAKQLSFMVAKEADANYIAGLVSNRSNIAEVAVIDDYSDSEKMIGKKKITLVIEVINDIEGETAYFEIQNLLRGIGCFIL